MHNTLRIPISGNRRKNQRRTSPWKRFLVLAAILLGIATLIVLCSGPQPGAYISEFHFPLIPEAPIASLS